MSRPLTTPQALEAAGLVSAKEAEALAPVADRYAIAITPFLAGRIDRNDPGDPIARMFVPQPEEMIRTPEELADPIGDEAHTPVKGIVHRYPDRVLLKPVAVCPVYCRFCFRREMVGPGIGETLSPTELEAALAYIQSQPGVREVIRWHTRMPVADPDRITPEFVEALKAPGKAVYVSIHINHAKELAPETQGAVARLADAGFPLISQSVLLHGVNDQVDVLADLMQALVAHRIRPYYLHHPDLAPGTGHFRLSVEEGQALYSALRDRVSGLAVPHYVIDIPGGVSKANAAASDVIEAAEGRALRGRDGKLHPYRG